MSARNDTSCVDFDDDQYGPGEIVMIWASVTLPMGALAWIVAPWLIARALLDPGVIYWLCMIVGMGWQFVIAVTLLRAERRNWTWSLLKARLWLTTPVHPSTGRRSALLFLWIVPGVLFVSLTSDLLGPLLDAPLRWLFPAFHMPFYTDIRELISPRYEGEWWLLGIAAASCLFNYVLGEALLFHGVLLPKMRGAFGQRAWAANAILFGLYHVHLAGQAPSIIVSNIAYSLPAQRYRSAWLALAIHGFEGVIVMGMTTWVVLGRPGTG